MAASASAAGTSPWAIRSARPSTSAVLPTPESPTKIGLFLRRRASTWIARSSSRFRPTSGSSSPRRASSVSSWVKVGERVAPGLLLVVVLVVLVLVVVRLVVGVRLPAVVARIEQIGLGDAVGQVAHQVEAAHPLLLQEVDGERLRLGVHRHHHVRTPDLLLARPLALRDRAREHPLEGEGRRRLAPLGGRQHSTSCVEEGVEAPAQAVDVGAGALEHPAGDAVLEQDVEQVLEAGVLVAALGGLHERGGERELEVGGELHAGSTVHRRGMPS